MSFSFFDLVAHISKTRAFTAGSGRAGGRSQGSFGPNPTFSVAPYGYVIERSVDAPKGCLVVEEIEAEHVRAMYRWVAEEGLSVWKVTKRLNALGVRPRRKKFWGQSSIYRILTNSVYAGKAIFGKHEFVEPKRPRKPGGYRKIRFFRLICGREIRETPATALVT